MLDALTAGIDGLADDLRTISDYVWEHPELALREAECSRVLADRLARAGFSVRHGIAGLPTAFVAEFGCGGPTIGLLGEFDALPGLSQRKASLSADPLVPGGPGHGCGHNLLGTAALGAAIAVAGLIADRRIHGTVRFYGCPAEETLVGKVFMAKAGVFDDLDAALTWHPGSCNRVAAAAHLAMNSARFAFQGVAAHAAVDPENGASALDAVELMNVGVNFLREHVPASSRIHYVITDGGQAPNVVPERAEVWYYVRAPERQAVERIFARVKEIARGAALMTGTTQTCRLECGCYDTLANRVLGDVLHAEMERIGAPTFSSEDHDLARRLQATFAEGAVDAAVARLRRQGAEVEDRATLLEGVQTVWGYGETGGGSTDVGDVSWIVPTGQINAVTAPVGTPAHSWQNVVSVGSPIGQAGMRFAAKVLAAATADLLAEPELLRRARDEFERATRDHPYVSPVRDVNPPPA